MSRSLMPPNLCVPSPCLIRSCLFLGEDDGERSGWRKCVRVRSIGESAGNVGDSGFAFGPGVNDCNPEESSFETMRQYRFTGKKLTQIIDGTIWHCNDHFSKLFKMANLPERLFCFHNASDDLLFKCPSAFAMAIAHDWSQSGWSD